MISCLSNISNVKSPIQITLIAIGIFSVALGIWQLYQPIISHYTASGWAFIAPGAVGVAAALVWKLVQFVLESKKKLPDRFETINHNIGDFSKLPLEARLEIFSYLDLDSLIKLQEVSKSFFNEIRDHIANNLKIQFLRAIKSFQPKTLSGHIYGVDSVFYGDKILFSGSNDQTIKVWREIDGNWICQATLQGHTNRIKSIFYKDGILFSGSDDQTIKVWREVIGNWICQATLQGHADWVRIVFYGDEILFSGSDDQTIKVWREVNGNWICQATLQGHADWVRSVFYGDGILFSGSDDRTIKVWREIDGNWICQATLQGYTALIRSVFYRDGILSSESYDRTIKVWREVNRNWICQATLRRLRLISGVVFKEMGSSSADTMIKL